MSVMSGEGDWTPISHMREETPNPLSRAAVTDRKWQYFTTPGVHHQDFLCLSSFPIEWLTLFWTSILIVDVDQIYEKRIEHIEVDCVTLNPVWLCACYSIRIQSLSPWNECVWEQVNWLLFAWRWGESIKFGTIPKQYIETKREEK